MAPRWKVGSSLVPRVMWVHAERHREGGPCASHHQLGSLRMDGQAEAKTIFLKKKPAVVFNAGSLLLLEGANIKGRGTFWKKLSFQSMPALLKREAGVLGGGGARVPHARP